MVDCCGNGMQINRCQQPRGVVIASPV